MFSKDQVMFFKLDDDTIAINLWCGIYMMNTPSEYRSNIECNIKNMVDLLQCTLKLIKKEYNINIKLDDFSPELFIPIIPSTDINLFENWYNTHNISNKNKFIFYYNYDPKSFQRLPILDHDTLRNTKQTICINY